MRLDAGSFVVPPQDYIRLSAGARSVPAAQAVRGSVRVPGDKSISHRAALFNALADGTASIRNFSSGR